MCLSILVESCYRYQGEDCCIVDVQTRTHFCWDSINKVKFSNGIKKVSTKDLPDYFCIITSEEIANKMKEIGVSEVEFLRYEGMSLTSSRSGRGITVQISPSILQKLINDNDFRERMFELLRENVELTSDTRFEELSRGTFNIRMTSHSSEREWSLAVKWAMQELCEDNFDDSGQLIKGEEGRGLSLVKAMFKAHSESLSRRLALSYSQNRLAQSEGMNIV